MSEPRNWRITVGVIVTIVAAVLWGLPADAQEYRGNLRVQVVDADEKSVVGATVTLSGQDFDRTATSDDGGRVRFASLEPGLYKLTTRSSGFATVVMNDLEINTLSNVDLSVEMTSSSQLEETIVITAETPLFDQRKTGTSTILTQRELSQIPQSRDPWAVLSTVPGITTDRVNVGGNESGQQSNFVTRGDDGRNTTWVVDGVEVTDMAAIGASSTYYDFNSFEEIGFVTGGGDVEQITGGARLNFSTKQGSNTTTGNIRLWYTEEGLQDDVSSRSQPDNVDTEVNVLPENLINEVFEKNFDIGGPVWKDHVWYWFGFSQNDIDNSIAGTSDKTKLKSTSLKLHGQASTQGNWKAFYTDTDKSKDGRGAAPTRPIETTWDQKGPSPIYTGYLTWFFNPNFNLSVQAAKVDGQFSLTPKGGLDAQIINDENNIWNGSFVLYDTERPQDQYTIKGNNYVETGSWEHEIKYGYRYKDSTVESLSKWSNDDFFVYSGAYVFLYRERTLELDMTHETLWLSDTLLHGPWAINAGLTYTQQEGENKARTIPGVGLDPDLLPGLDYQGSKAPYGDWSNVTPRLGVTYTFDMEKRLMLRANYAQYVDQLNAEDVAYDNPGGQYVYIYADWVDDGDGQVQDGEFSTDCTDYAGTVDPCDPLNFLFKIDPNYEAPETEEFILGAEYEVAPDFVLGLNIIDRTRDNDRWYEGNLDFNPTAYLGPLYDVPHYESTGQLRPIPASAYDCSATVEGEFPDGSEYEEPICSLSAAGMDLTGPSMPTFLTNRPGYEQTYQAVEISATKRLSNKWMLRGFLSWNEWEQDFSGTSGISDPTNYQGGTTQDGGDVSVPSSGSGTKDGVWPGTSGWQVNVNGLYQLPYDVTISGNIYGREGFGLPYYHRSFPQDVQIGTVTDQRYDDLWTVDFKVAKTIKANETLVELSGEVFNLLDEDTILGQNVRVDQPTNVNAIRETLSPRIVRFGASIQF